MFLDIVNRSHTIAVPNIRDSTDAIPALPTDSPKWFGKKYIAREFGSVTPKVTERRLLVLYSAFESFSAL